MGATSTRSPTLAAETRRRSRARGSRCTRSTSRSRRTTYAPTIKSCENEGDVFNHAVFARLVQSLWSDVAASRREYACTTAASQPRRRRGTRCQQAVCNKLTALWVDRGRSRSTCASSRPSASRMPPRLRICGLARNRPSRHSRQPCRALRRAPIPYNRLGELQARTDVFQHVWDERFLKSIKPAGFCREKGTCAP